MSLEPWIEKQGKKWVVRWRSTDGKRTDEFRYDRRSDAVGRKDIIRDRLKNKSLGKIDLSRSVADCMSKHLEFLENSQTTKTEVTRYALRHFSTFKDDDGNVCIRDLEAITQKNIINFMNYLQSIGLSQHTVQTYMGRIRFWVNWCVKQDWIPGPSPFVDIEIPSPDKINRSFSNPELQDLINVIDNPEFLAIFNVVLMCGLRPPEEVLRIHSDHIRRIEQTQDQSIYGEIYVPPNEGKTKNAGRYVPLPWKVYNRLPKVEGLLFKSWTAQRIDRHMAKAKLRAKIEDLVSNGRIYHKSLYWCRHAYARRYLERGGSLSVLSRRMGHGSIEITHDTYGHMERHNIQDVVVPCIEPGSDVSGQIQGDMEQKERPNDQQTHVL